MRFHALSIGWKVDVSIPRMGAVHSVFDRAVNLLVDGEMWTVLGASRSDGPFGIRLSKSEGGFEVKAGDPVSIRAGFVRAGCLVVDGRNASRWAPTEWTQPTDGLAARLADLEAAVFPRAWSESAGMAANVIATLHGTETELIAAVRRTVGRGPGLTPSGDDVLAGIFALLTSGAAGAAGMELASRLVRALAPALPTTSDISRHLLSQAARGLPGRALHDLGKALIEGASHDIFSDALALVLDTGAASGADACMGFAAACRFLFLNTELAAA
jgi:hypothetical protein